jgi:hypothetical protein
MHVLEMLGKEADDEARMKIKHKMGKRAVDAIEEHWSSIIATAAQSVLTSCGDHILEASVFGLPERLTLRDACGQSRSALWLSLLVACVHTSLDAGCVLLARDLRRSLRKRIARLRPLNAVHTDRSDSLIATLHINWGSMLMASTGRPRHVVKRNSLSLRTLQGKIENIEDEMRLGLSVKVRARSKQRARQGLPPDELIEPKATPRQKRLDMHERHLGIVEPKLVEPATDEDDENYGVMARVDMHVRRMLAALKSPSRWVRQTVGLALGAVHSSSIVVVVHALVRRFDESRGRAALALARAERLMRDVASDARKHAVLPAQQLAFGDEDSDDDGDDLTGTLGEKANAIAKQQLLVQQHLTRLMRMLTQHKGMATALDSCPDLLRQVATFVRRVGDHLFAQAKRLLRTGRALPPTHAHAHTARACARALMRSALAHVRACPPQPLMPPSSAHALTRAARPRSSEPPTRPTHPTHPPGETPPDPPPHPTHPPRPSHPTHPPDPPTRRL